MSTHNIQFHDQIRKFPSIFVFLTIGRISLGLKNEFESYKVNTSHRGSGHRGFTVYGYKDTIK